MREMEILKHPGGEDKEVFDPEFDQYLLFDKSGALLKRRPLTPEEWASYGAEVRNERDLDAKVAAQVPDLLVMMTDLQARLDIPKDALTNTELRRTIKDVRQLARAVIQIARLVGNVLDSTDSGTP